MATAKAFPTSARFLLADDIREEKDSNKITLIGTYVGDNIGIKDLPGGHLPMLALLGLFSGGEGSFNLEVKVFGPNGAELGESVKYQPITMHAGLNQAVVLKLPGFHVPEFGEYRVSFSFDQTESFEYRFTVKQL
jgi:hypothetical protein